MNGSTLARFGIGALIVCAAAAPGAALADTPTLNPSGTLTFSWRGDPARGCEAAGVCAVSGSLEVIPADQSGSVESPRSRNIQIEDDAAVVRVTDPGSTPAQPHICTQLTPVSMVLTVSRRQLGGLRALVVPFSPPTSGDCAGPPALGLGNFTLPARRLAGATEAYDLSTTSTFGSGPYTVTAKSTIRARRPSGAGGGGSGVVSSSSGEFPGAKPFKGLVEHVSIDYRITTTSGTVTTTFGGLADPFCLPLDACGAGGTLTDVISGVSHTLEFDAQRVVTRRASRRQALADLRSGRLPLSDTGELLSDILSANVGWSAGSTCTDRLTQFDALSVSATSSADHKRVAFDLATDRVEDPFRTSCPGPGAGDVLGSSDTLARASLPLRELGRGSLRIVAERRSRFVAGSYAGARSGGVTIGLRLVRVRAGTKTETVFP